MKLQADLSSDLDWKVEVPAPVLWELDFDFQFSEMAFHSYVLAVEKFVEIWKQYSGLGVVFYRGSIDIIRKTLIEDPVEAANFFAAFLHRLASFLPEEIEPFCLFEGPHSFGVGKGIQLMSKRRFRYLSLVPALGREGFLLPLDQNCTPEVLAAVEKHLRPRVIPEEMLYEMWADLDHLVVIEEGVTEQGRRQLKGFEAAGGVVEWVRSRGI